MLRNSPKFDQFAQDIVGKGRKRNMGLSIFRPSDPKPSAVGFSLFFLGLLLSAPFAYANNDFSFNNATIVPMEDSVVSTGQDPLKGWKPTTTAGNELSALMADAAICKGKVETEKKSADPIAKAKINKENICPNLSEMPALSALTKDCDNAVGKMESSFNAWQAAKDQSCSAQADLETKCAGESCFKVNQANIQKAKAAAKAELETIAAAKKSAVEIDRIVANILDQIGTAKGRLEEVESQREYNTGIVQASREATAAGDNGAATLEHAQSKYQASAQKLRTVAAQLIKTGTMPKDSGISGDRPSAEADPVKIGKANSDFKDALTKRETELNERQKGFWQTEVATGDRRTDMGSLGNPASSLNGNPLSDVPVGSLAQAGATVAAGSLSHSGPGGGLSAEKRGLISSLTNIDHFSLPKSTLANLNNNQQSSASKMGGPSNDIAPKASDSGEEGGVNSTATSLAPSGSIRESLQARLKKNLTSGASMMGDPAKADSTKSGSEEKEGDLAKNSSPSASPKLLNSEGEIITDNMGSLGASDFSLDGSDTDAFIQNMVEDAGLAVNRGIASLSGENSFGMSEAQLLSEEGPSLFQRVKSTNDLYVKRGNIIRGLRSKL